VCDVFQNSFGNLAIPKSFGNLAHLCLTVIQFICNLAGDTSGTATSCHGILTGVSLQTVLFSKLSTEHKEGDAGGNAGEQEVQDPTLTSLFSTDIELAATAEGSTKT
jgi:hypothetical protein